MEERRRQDVSIFNVLAIIIMAYLCFIGLRQIIISLIETDSIFGLGPDKTSLWNLIIYYFVLPLLLIILIVSFIMKYIAPLMTPN